MNPGEVDSRELQSGGGAKTPGDWIPGLLSALGSLFLLRSGFLGGIFFLVPLGIAGCLFGNGAMYKGALLAVLFNVLFVLGLGLFLRRDFGGVLPELGYFFLVALSFTWLMAPPARGPRIFRVRAAYRLSLGALAGGLAGMGFIFADSTGFSGLIRAQAEFFSSLAVDSAGGDAVRRSLLEQELSPQRIAQVFRTILLRGGAAASSVFILFVSRQFSLGIAALAARGRGIPRRGGSALRDFHSPPHLIWVFSGSLAGILLFSLGGLSVPETALWNILTLCGLMYLAQGFGIVQFFLGRRDLPAPLRILLNVGIILAILSPGINMAVLALLMLLGIAEYWAPMRRASRKHLDDPPTPAA